MTIQLWIVITLLLSGIAIPASQSASPLVCPKSESRNCGSFYEPSQCEFLIVKSLCPYMCGPCGQHEAPKPDYVVEAYVVVDATVVGNYAELGYNTKMARTSAKQDVYLLMNEVNKKFSSMNKYGLNIEIRTKQLAILGNDELYGKETLSDRDSLQFLKDFGRWLDDKDAHRRFGYDVAVLLTGYKINKVDGRAAKIGGVCVKDESFSVVEFFGTQQASHLVAHMVAHTLGARHDMEEPERCRLSPPTGWVMNRYFTERLMERRRGFSICSVYYITRMISSLDATGNNCLTNTPTLV